MPTIRDVVQALSRRPGVQAAIVLGRDGLPIDSAVRDGVDADGVAALVPPVVAACGRLGDASASCEFGAGAVEFAAGTTLVATLSPDALAPPNAPHAATTGGTSAATPSTSTPSRTEESMGSPSRPSTMAACTPGRRESACTTSRMVGMGAKLDATETEVKR